MVIIVYRKWYSNKTVQYEIVNALKDKYLTVLSDEGLNIAYISIRSVKDLNFYMDKYKLYNGKFNFYFTVNNYKWKNFFDIRFDLREKEYEYFRTGKTKGAKRSLIFKTHEETLISRDMNFDFDAHGETDILNTIAYKEILLLSHYFNSKHYVFYVKMSGTGWHLTLPNYLERNERAEEKSLFAEVMAKYDFRSLDKNVYNDFQVLKCPYTVDKKTGNVVLPVNTQDLITIKSYNFKEILRTTNLFGRGLKKW